MNRIAGIFHFDGIPVAYTEIDQMINALKLQALDKQNIWIKGGVGLGCTQLGNKLNRQNDPVLSRSPDEQWVITFDGRIDNRRELLEALRPQWLAGRARISDEELVLAAYEKWELECPKHLIGDFAFAIWDANQHQLVCVRDHFGVKPLYYYAADTSFFLFASTPEALLASGKVPLAIQEERIADHFVNPLDGIDKTSSFYRDVFRLPPAHLLIVRDGRSTLQRYWELCPTVQTESRADEEYIETFLELFSEAIRCRLQDSAIPASMLSGGMDSSAIVGIGRKAMAEEGKSLHVFAGILNSAGSNRETPHIFSVLDQGNVQSHVISESELFQCMDELVGAIENEAEPFEYSMNLNRSLYLHSREVGASALLDGIDGDGLLSGTGHLTQLWRHGAYRMILEETFMADGLTAEYKMGRSLLVNSFLSAISPFAPDWLRNIRRKHRYRIVVPSSIRETIIDREFAVRSQLGERFAKLDSHGPRPPSLTQVEFHKIALEHPFLTVGLERYERVASAFGIEARHPFTDVRLVEFCLSLPWQLKTHRGWTKMILRRAMEPYLPIEVIWRKDKDSLMWEVNRLILKARAEYFYQITCDEKANLKPYVDLGKLMQSWQEYLTQGNEEHAEWIWSGLALAMWLRRQRKLFHIYSPG